MEKEVRSARHKSPIGPTCFGFEEVQPAKLSLRDVESSSFFSLSSSFSPPPSLLLSSSLPSLFLPFALYFYLSADFTRFTPCS